MNNQAKLPLYTLPILTPDGEFRAHYSPKGLCGLEFPAGARRSTRRSKHRPEAAELTLQVRRWHAITAKAVGRALTGQPVKHLPPIDLSSGTEFQQRVWRALRGIVRGRTLSYTQVARAIGRPKAVRAVGGACGANPLPVLVPCHRVVAANRRLGGFSGGLWWKRTLLAREGVHAR